MTFLLVIVSDPQILTFSPLLNEAPCYKLVRAQGRRKGDPVIVFQAFSVFCTMATVSSLSSSSDLLAHIQSGGTANRSFGIAFSSPPPISPPASFAVSPSACHDLLPRFSLHPLEQAWCLWFFKGDRNAEWEENLRYITSFDNVEGFWSLFNHLETPSNLPSNTDYSLFKVNITLDLVLLMKLVNVYLSLRRISSPNGRMISIAMVGVGFLS